MNAHFRNNRSDNFMGPVSERIKDCHNCESFNDPFYDYYDEDSLEVASTEVDSLDDDY